MIPASLHKNINKNNDSVLDISKEEPVEVRNLTHVSSGISSDNGSDTEKNNPIVEDQMDKIRNILKQSIGNTNGNLLGLGQFLPVTNSLLQFNALTNFMALQNFQINTSKTETIEEKDDEEVDVES